MSNNPTVFKLRNAVVLTNDTVNGNGVTCNGFNIQLVITGCTVCIPSTVNGEDLAGLVGDLHITVGRIVNLGNNTGYVVLALGESIVLLGRTKIDTFFYGESRISCWFTGNFGSAVGSSKFVTDGVGPFSLATEVNQTHAIVALTSKTKQKIIATKLYFFIISHFLVSVLQHFCYFAPWVFGG